MSDLQPDKIAGWEAHTTSEGVFVAAYRPRAGWSDSRLAAVGLIVGVIVGSVVAVLW